MPDPAKELDGEAGRRRPTVVDALDGESRPRLAIEDRTAGGVRLTGVAVRAKATKATLLARP